MKKLLFLINRLDVGGAEKILINTVNSLDTTKYGITVQTVIGGGILQSELNSNIRYKSIVQHKNKYLRYIFTYLINFILPATMVYKIFIKDNYDYEIAFLEGVPTKLIAGSTNKKSKKYAWVHTDLLNNYGLNKVYKNVETQFDAYKKYDKIICVSKSVKEAFINKMGNNAALEVKYNIINDKLINKKALVDIPKKDKFRIVTVGRLAEQKGFDRLLRIHNRLVHENYDYELYIVGEGTQRCLLEDYIEKNNLSESVILTGYTDNPYKYLNSADLVVFPSKVEGFSTAATEAVILGKPVVATDCAGMREIFGNSECGIVTENNEEALYNGIKTMLMSDVTRLDYEKKAKERSKDFCMEERLRELEKLFV